jgi:hypothetical protein
LYDYSVRQTKPTPPEQPQKAQNYVSDAADGCFMLKYVLSPNLVIFVSLFQISGAKRKKNLLCWKIGSWFVDHIIKVG